MRAPGAFCRVSAHPPRAALKQSPDATQPNLKPKPKPSQDPATNVEAL